MHRKHSIYLQQLFFYQRYKGNMLKIINRNQNFQKKLNRLKCFRFHEFLEQGYTPFPIIQILTINQKKYLNFCMLLYETNEQE